MSDFTARTVTVTVFTRHSEECPQKDNRQWKRCKCRKSLYIYSDGKVTYKSAKTRSWEQAERVAQTERDLRDPVKRKELQLEEEIRKVQEQADVDAAARKANLITVSDALDRWLS
jgi:hypothetical protein